MLCLFCQRGGCGEADFGGAFPRFAGVPPTTNEIVHVTDPVQFARRQVLLTPAVVIDGQVKCGGRVPSLDEVKAWLGAVAA